MATPNDKRQPATQPFEYEDARPSQTAPAGSGFALGIARGGQVAADRGQAMLNAAATSAPAISGQVPATPGIPPNPAAPAGSAAGLGVAVQAPGQPTFAQRGDAMMAASGFTPRAMTPAPAPGATADGMSYGDQMAHVGGAITGGLATLAKHIVSAPGYGFNSPSSPASTGAAPAGTIPAGASTAGAGRGFINPALVQPAPTAVAGSAAGLPGGTSSSTSSTSTVEGAPGVTKVIGPDGKVGYTNVAGGFVPGGGTVSARNDAAATQLAARSQATGATAQATPGAAGPAESQMAVVPVHAFGFKTPEEQGQQLDLRGLSRQQATQATLQAQEQATRAALGQDQLQVQREGHAVTSRGQDQQSATANARLGFDREQGQRTGVLTSAQAGEAQARAQSLQTINAAQKAYETAVAGGDPKAVAAARANLAAVQGKTDTKNFSVHPISAGIDPLTGQPRGAGAVILNEQSGESRFVSPTEAQGGSPGAPAGPAKGIAKGDYDKLPKGARYTGPDGKDYIKS